MNSSQLILSVRGLNTGFISDRKLTRIVKDVSFDLERGKVMAVVGESGCGKSVLMNSILRFLGKNAVSTAERISFYKKEADGSISEQRIDQFRKPNGPEMRALRGPHISMVFQDPMSALNPAYRVGHQVIEGLREHFKMSKKEAMQKALEMFQKLSIPDAEARLQSYPHEFSGGMKQRVVIAIAMICNPELIICDEPTTALDVTIQAQIMEILQALKEKEGKSIILVTHNMGLVAQMADTVCVMYMGRIVESGPLEAVFDHPSHLYTRALLRSVPVLGMKPGTRLQTIPGSTPNPSELGTGCEFADRCEYCRDACRAKDVPLYAVAPGHNARCILFNDRPEVH